MKIINNIENVCHIVYTLNGQLLPDIQHDNQIDAVQSFVKLAHAEFEVSITDFDNVLAKAVNMFQIMEGFKE